MENQQIPIYESRRPRSRIYGYADHDWILANKQHFDLVITRRAKRIKMAYLRGLSSHAVKLLPQALGQCIRQHLPESGHVCYALGGVRGSN